MTARLLRLLALLLLPWAGDAAALPRILASADNPVPQCVRPAALMDFVAERNAQRSPPRTIDPRYDNLAALYQRIGQCVARPPDKCVAVRWDYAFFQMLIETNYLTFRRPNGVPAAVVPADNNFAGVGATVSGKPGERFKDVATGVLAHLQHVLMYSTVAHPQSGREPHAPGAGRRAGGDAPIAPAGDLRRSRARMDRHRPQHIRCGNAKAGGEIRGGLLHANLARRRHRIDFGEIALTHARVIGGTQHWPPAFPK